MDGIIINNSQGLKFKSVDSHVPSLIRRIYAIVESVQYFYYCGNNVRASVSNGGDLHVAYCTTTEDAQQVTGILNQLFMNRKQS